MPFTIKYKIPALVAALFLSACSLVGEEGGDCPEPVPAASDNITLSFKMISANIGSRADSDGHDEVDSEWRDFEDRIDISDFAFFIFLENGADGKKPLVMKMINYQASLDPNNMITGANGIYTITTVIPKTQLSAALGHEITPDGNDIIDFRIVLLANTKAVVGSTYDYGSLNTTDYADFIADATSTLSYNMNASLHSANAGDSQVSGIYKGAIPMFGQATFRTTEPALYASRPEERIYLGDVWMLRSLAKVRVVDASPKNDAGYPYIKEVSVEGITDMAHQLPADAAGYSNGSQVHTPNPVTNTSSTAADCTFKLGYSNSTAERFGYIPEQFIRYGRPVIHIKAQIDEQREKDYAIPMGGNDEYSTVNFGETILRNHIYTLEVNSIAVGTPADLTVNVALWDEVTNVIDYTENVSVSNTMDWISGFESDANGVVVVRGAADPLVGRFRIATPVGATWQASFLGVEGNPDFKFRITTKADDGSTTTTESSYAEGVISGTSDFMELTIVSPPATTVTNRAQLQVIVIMGNGTVMEANVAGDYKRYTIVQNRQ